jgi:hypothetical protein
LNPRLVELLAAQPASCRLWPEQTAGPYDRPVHPERGDITEDRIGLPLRIGLRLVDAQTGTPLVGVPVEVWHADHAGRYAGFAPFTPPPARSSPPRRCQTRSWLRQRRSCAACSARTQTGCACLKRFTRAHPPPVRRAPPRDTTSATDSILAAGGARTVLQLTGDTVGGLTGVLCLGIEPDLAPVDSASASRSRTSPRGADRSAQTGARLRSQLRAARGQAELELADADTVSGARDPLTS